MQGYTADGALRPTNIDTKLTYASCVQLTMVWTDPMSSALGATLVLHDLDLSVKNERTGRVYFPNGLNQRETRHNVEKVSATGPGACRRDALGIRPDFVCS